MLIFQDSTLLKYAFRQITCPHLFCQYLRNEDGGRCDLVGHRHPWSFLFNNFSSVSPNLPSCWPLTQRPEPSSLPFPPSQQPFHWRAAFDTYSKMLMDVVGHTLIFHFLESFVGCCWQGSPSLEIGQMMPCWLPSFDFSLGQAVQLWQWRRCQKQWPVVSPVGQGEAQRAEPVVLL